MRGHTHRSTQRTRRRSNGLWWPQATTGLPVPLAIGAAQGGHHSLDPFPLAIPAWPRSPYPFCFPTTNTKANRGVICGHQMQLAPYDRARL